MKPDTGRVRKAETAGPLLLHVSMQLSRVFVAVEREKDSTVLTVCTP